MKITIQNIQDTNILEKLVQANMQSFEVDEVLVKYLPSRRSCPYLIQMSYEGKEIDRLYYDALKSMKEDLIVFTKIKEPLWELLNPEKYT